MPKIIDETGNIYFRLTVLHRKLDDKKSVSLWVCICSCGNKTTVAGSGLRAGTTKSCGCYQSEFMSKTPANKKRGNYSKRLYGIWYDMLRRCDDTKAEVYKYYGARGIKVCYAWYDFNTFAEEMGEPTSITHTLDRTDNDGLYIKSNCTWATKKQQANNRRKEVRVKVRDTNNGYPKRELELAFYGVNYG